MKTEVVLPSDKHSLKEMSITDSIHKHTLSLSPTNFITTRDREGKGIPMDTCKRIEDEEEKGRVQIRFLRKITMYVLFGHLGMTLF